MGAPESATSQDAALSSFLSAGIGSPETSVPDSPSRAAQLPDSPPKWIEVRGEYVFVSRSNWVYPHATGEEAGPRDVQRYAAIGKRDGDIVLRLSRDAYVDNADLATMLDWTDQPTAAAAGNAQDLPELNSDLIDILGRPNFTCIRLAQLLRLSGFEIAKKAENEQATVIHYLLGFYLRYGSQWAEEADEDLEQRRVAATAAQQDKGGEE